MTIAEIVAPTTAGDALRARPAGFVHDVGAIAGRALRGVPRDLEAVTPPMFIALFFFIVNIATLSKLTQSAGAGFDYKAFQMPTAILLGVTGVSRAPALVLDVQDGYLDRLLMTPIRRIAILLGHMVADVVGGHGRDLADSGPRLRHRRALQDGRARRPHLHRHRRLVEPGLLRLRLRHRPEDRESSGGELDVPAVLPLSLPDLVLCPSFPAVGLAEHRRRPEPGDLSPRRSAVPRQPGLGLERSSARPSWPSPCSECSACRSAWPRSAAGPVGARVARPKLDAGNSTIATSTLPEARVRSEFPRRRSPAGRPTMVATRPRYERASPAISAPCRRYRAHPPPATTKLTCNCSGPVWAQPVDGCETKAAAVWLGG